MTRRVHAEGAEPIGGDEFSSIMAGFGPFEPAPTIAAAVSGGADSLALAVLLHDWTARQGGSILALTVDHGLRPGSAAEAARVGRSLADLGIRQAVLRWRGDKPATGIQAAAREARYELLRACCRNRNILHLALGHHLEDQAETLLLRLARGSGLEGLSGMAALRELPELRLLRPLLSLPKARLEASLRARRLAWLEDPSNRDTAFARVRLRGLMPSLAREGLTAARLGQCAAEIGRARAALEDALATLLARAVAVHAAGYACLDPQALREASPVLSRRALAACLMTVGGADYAPRGERQARLHAKLVAGMGQGATLGGCRIVPRRGRLLVSREASRTPSVEVRPGQRLLWDGRFTITLGRRPGPGRGPITIGSLGAAGWRALVEIQPHFRTVRVPPVVRPSLPALRDELGLISVPALGYRRGGWTASAAGRCNFTPRHPLTAAAFTVV